MLGVRMLQAAAGRNNRYKMEVLASQPIAYWRLGESAGTVAADEMGSYPGTYAGGVALGADGLVADSDSAVLLDGASGYISLGAMAFNPVSGNWSLELWHQTPQSFSGNANDDIYSQQDGSGTGRTWLSRDATNLVGAGPNRLVTFLGGTGKSLGFTLAADSTYHIVLCCDRSVGKITCYVNGANVSEVLITLESATGGHQAGVSKRLIDSFTHGVLDEIAFYSRILTEEESLHHYKAGIGA